MLLLTNYQGPISIRVRIRRWCESQEWKRGISAFPARAAETHTHLETSGWQSWSPRSREPAATLPCPSSLHRGCYSSSRRWKPLRGRIDSKSQDKGVKSRGFNSEHGRQRLAQQTIFCILKGSPLKWGQEHTERGHINGWIQDKIEILFGESYHPSLAESPWANSYMTCSAKCIRKKHGATTTWQETDYRFQIWNHLTRTCKTAMLMNIET